jgi:hypothetical protein
VANKGDEGAYKIKVEAPLDRPFASRKGSGAALTNLAEGSSRSAKNQIEPITPTTIENEAPE